MTTEADDILLAKITTLLDDILKEGGDNGEAMFLLGSAAADLADSNKKENWRAFKASLSINEVIDFLQMIDKEGNRLLDEDKVTFAYALQVIGMSLAVTDDSGDELKHGAFLLDDVIETTLINYRNYVRTRTTPVN